MAIIVTDSGGGSYTPHPEGQFSGVCVDVRDLGPIETKWGIKDKLDLFFYCNQDKQTEDGVVHLLVLERFTKTLNEKGNLRAFLERWRGQKFTPEELKGFDLEVLIGAPAFLQISHNEYDGKTYANIDTIMKLPKSETAPGIPSDYVRFIDREAPDEPPAHVQTGGPPPIEDDDLPFAPSVF